MDDNKILPKIGLGAIIIREGKILLGKRIGKHGNNTWAPPGGLLEFNEEIEHAVEREVLEETGLKSTCKALYTVTNNIFLSEGKHTITLFYFCEANIGEARIMEPTKCEKWEWFSWNELPEKLFLPLQILKDKGMDPTKNI
ncbi:MAG: NUDIX domain-containing protein [archaeon]|jgi:8-oxo-dGTP diphosphatase